MTKKRLMKIYILALNDKTKLIIVKLIGKTALFMDHKITLNFPRLLTVRVRKKNIRFNVKTGKMFTISRLFNNFFMINNY
jgi:hypothetical protein